MKDLLDNIYNGKTVLVTGHTGFKGSWLCIWLREIGAKVIGYGLDPHTSKDNFVVSELDKKIIDIRGDIRDDKKLQDVFNEYNPDIVFHLAAQPLVRLSYERPKETYETNVIGTLNILECIRKSSSVKAGIMITTDKCYENKEQIWAYRECDSMGGYDPYSSSKGCCELLISSYRNSYMNPKDYEVHGKSIASVRAGNVIGGGDWSLDRIVPDCIQALLNDKEIQIRNPKSIRPWQFVLEPLFGYLLLGANMYKDGEKYYGAWNFGPDNNSIIPVYELVESIIKEFGYGSWKNVSSDKSLHEANLLNLDITKARMLLKWNPVYNIEDSIKNTIEWYKLLISENDMYKVCKNQIVKYVENIKIKE